MSKRARVGSAFEAEFNASIKLRDAGRPLEAVALLEPLLAMEIESRSAAAAVNGELGGLYLFDLRKPDIAERFYRRARELSPASEMASIGLFHALMGQLKVVEALNEMLGFLERNPACEEYNQVLKEIAMAVDGKIVPIRR
jgi:hypothetical protein